MAQEFLRALLSSDPVGDMQSAAYAQNQIFQQQQAQKTEQQLQALRALQIQQAPQQFQQEQAYKSALTQLAQAQAAAEPEKAKAAEYLNELRAAVMQQKFIQAKNPVSPSDKKFAEEDAKKLVDYKSELDRASEVSDKIINEANELQRLYNDVPYYQKGTILGKTPAATDAASAFDNNSSSLIFDMMSQLGSLGVSQRQFTDMMKSILQKSKPSRAYGEKDFKDITNRVISNAQRKKEEAAFFGKAIENGATRYTPISNAWLEHISDYPIQDPNTNEALPQNLNQWQPYATKEAVDASHNNQRVMPLGHNPPTIPSIHMTNTYGLSSETIQRITERAKRKGMSVDEYIKKYLPNFVKSEGQK
jgi:hypothetical protein